MAHAIDTYIARYLKVLAILHTTLAESTTVTKRDIYYQAPALFKSQVVVDNVPDLRFYSMGGKEYLTLIAVSRQDSSKPTSHEIISRCRE